jgi:acetyl-CoA/propionyl-CoA carboxylase biotin carboxyl carrier protein
MAKLIVTGATRAQAIARARRALKEFRIEGLPTVLPFHRAVMAHPDFVSGDAFKVHTRWIETDFANGEAPAMRPDPLPDAALVRTAIEVDGRRLALGLPGVLLSGLSSVAAGGGIARAEAAVTDAAAVAAPVSGTLQGWKVADGDEVAEGAVVTVMEAMKMEMQVVAHRAGRIAFAVAAGGYVAAGAALATIG